MPIQRFKHTTPYDTNRYEMNNERQKTKAYSISRNQTEN